MANDDYSLQINSPAIDTGNLSIANEVPYDIRGSDRRNKPDLGAYEK